MRKVSFLALISLLVLTLCCAVGCVDASDENTLKINVPETVIQAELGTYDLPSFDVVDADNLIYPEYTVSVSKVLDPDGLEVDIAYNKINATKKGIYQITYVAEGVSDAVLKVDFADRTPPTVKMDDDALPDYYVKGFSYSLPVYTITDGPAMDKCYVKVYYVAENQTERTEVTVENSQFEVTGNSGEYIIVIHVEDEVGNAKDYEYSVPAIGPTEQIPGKIVYFDEKFGSAQVKGYWNGFKLSYSTEMAYGDELGSTKVVCEGDSDYIILDKLLESDVSSYTHLVVRIYNANDYSVYSGYCWFADTVLEPKQWNEIRIPVSDLDSKTVSHPAVSGITINSHNITNLSLRLFDNYTTNKIATGSVFYISAMYAVTESNRPENVVDDKIIYSDEEFGLRQTSILWPAANKISFDKTVKYGEEAGSLRVSYVPHDPSEGYDRPKWNYVLFNNPYIKDISAYDYIGFNVYNPTEHSFVLGLLWCGDTTIAANGWTQVKFPVSLFEEKKVVNMSSAVMSATDIINLPMIFYRSDFEYGESFYISAMFAGKEEKVPQPEKVVDDKIAYFDETFGLNQISLYWNDPQTLAFDESVKLDGENGSLKITYNKEQQYNYLILKNPYIKDISSYDFIEFSVYNPTEHVFTIQLPWCGDTSVAANGWTKVKFFISNFNDGKVVDMSNNVLAASDITNLPICFWGTGFTKGESIYLSAIYGGKNDAGESTMENALVEFAGDSAFGNIRLHWADAQSLTIDTATKLDGEKGSLKITYNQAQGFNYLILNNPAIKDISEYDYITFKVYNPTDHEFVMQLLWAGDTTIAANGWTEVKFSLSLFAEKDITDVGGTKIETTDISNLAICFYGTGFEKGESIYVSAICVGKNAAQE